MLEMPPPNATSPNSNPPPVAIVEETNPATIQQGKKK
jgi:hypothetical protein